MNEKAKADLSKRDTREHSFYMQTPRGRGRTGKEGDANMLCRAAGTGGA